MCLFFVRQIICRWCYCRGDHVQSRHFIRSKKLRMIDSISNDHQNGTNQHFHVGCLPLWRYIDLQKTSICTYKDETTSIDLRAPNLRGIINVNLLYYVRFRFCSVDVESMKLNFILKENTDYLICCLYRFVT